MDNLKTFRFNSRDNGIRLTTMSSDIPKEKKRIVDQNIKISSSSNYTPNIIIINSDVSTV